MSRDPPPPAPLRRRGPRPLLLHLMLSALRSSVSIAASLPWSAAWPHSKGEDPRLPALRRARAADPEGFSRAVLARALAEDRALIAGIARYRRHPHQRALADPPTLWQEGETRLLDYGALGEGPRRRRAKTVLVIPSLVNRGTILDLDEGASLMRYLAGRGLRPYLLDWGYPDAAARDFTLTDYIAGRLERALAQLPERLLLIGYCMGGLLALAAAQRQRRRIRGLALLATPWDFHAADPEVARAVAGLLPAFEAAFAATGTLPVDLLQTLFVLLDPWGVAERYRAFGRLPAGSARARRFVVLEDWLNDGIPLSAPVARETLGGWYGENRPGRGLWRVAGEVVRPERLDLPAFIAIPERDRIVPPASAEALAALMPAAHVLRPRAGHVGMVAGMSAERALWAPLADFLENV